MLEVLLNEALPNSIYNLRSQIPHQTTLKINAYHDHTLKILIGIKQVHLGSPSLPTHHKVQSESSCIFC